MRKGVSREVVGVGPTACVLLLACAFSCRSRSQDAGERAVQPAVSSSSGAGAGDKSGHGAALPDEPNARLATLVRGNLDAELALRPTLASWLGDHGYDDKLDDVRTDAQLREASRLRVLAEQLRAIPEDKLSAASRLDHKLLLRRTEAALNELSDLRPLERNPLFYVDVAQAGVDSLVRGVRVEDGAMSADTLRSLNGRLTRMRGLFDEARRNLRSQAPELAVRRAIEHAQALRSFLSETLPHLVAAVPDQRLVEDWRAANGDAGRALDEFAGWLQRDFLPRAHGDLALGGGRFWERLRLQESLPVSGPGALDALVPRVEAALRDATRRLDDATKALGPQKLPLNTLLPPQRPDPQRIIEDDHGKAEELTLKTQLLVDALGTWGHDEALLPVPPTGLPRVVEMPPQLIGLVQLEANGPLEKHPRPPVVYLEPAMREQSEKLRNEMLRALNRPTLVLMLTHDLLGHFLVGLARRQAPTLMQRVSASLLLDEGFAAYAQRLLLEVGAYADDPKVRFVVERQGHLQLVRLLASIRFHAQGARLDDIAKLFAEQTDLDDSQARREAERVALDPLVGAEALGRLEIERLRTDWQAAHPTASLRELHAGLLAHGGTPIELLRDLVLAERR